MIIRRPTPASAVDGLEQARLLGLEDARRRTGERSARRTLTAKLSIQARRSTSSGGSANVDRHDLVLREAAGDRGLLARPAACRARGCGARLDRRSPPTGSSVLLALARGDDVDDVADADLAADARLGVDQDRQLALRRVRTAGASSSIPSCSTVFGGSVVGGDAVARGRRPRPARSGGRQRSGICTTSSASAGSARRPRRRWSGAARRSSGPTWDCTSATKFDTERNTASAPTTATPISSRPRRCLGFTGAPPVADAPASSVRRLRLFASSSGLAARPIEPTVGSAAERAGAGGDLAAAPGAAGGLQPAGQRRGGRVDVQGVDDHLGDVRAAPEARRLRVTGSTGTTTGPCSAGMHHVAHPARVAAGVRDRHADLLDAAGAAGSRRRCFTRRLTAGRGQLVTANALRGSQDWACCSTLGAGSLQPRDLREPRDRDELLLEQRQRRQEHAGRAAARPAR